MSTYMSPEARQALREEIEQQTKEYLARGGKITRVPPGVVAGSELITQDWDRYRLRGQEASRVR